MRLSASGAITYAYVGGDPVNDIDPLGLFVRPPVRPSPLRPGPVETPIIDDYFPPIGPPYNPPTNTLPPDIFPDTTIVPVAPDDIIPEPEPVGDGNQCPPEEKGKWLCEGYAQYEIIGQNKHVIRGPWFTAYGKDETIAAYNWKKKVQASAPKGHTARHIRPRCKKIK